MTVRMMLNRRIYQIRNPGEMRLGGSGRRLSCWIVIGEGIGLHPDRGFWTKTRAPWIFKSVRLLESGSDLNPDTSLRIATWSDF